jgi:hypothetical protein
MKVNSVCHWLGRGLPEKFSGPGPFELTAEELADLLLAYDVAFMHYFLEEIPTKKALKRGAKMPDDCIMMALDDKGKKFRQR